MFEQAILPVEDSVRFAAVRGSIEQTFTPATVEKYLRRLEGAKVRARNFEAAIKLDLLGRETAENYRDLPDSDRGQIRELYLSLVERVAPELRTKFLKVYAYY